MAGAATPGRFGKERNLPGSAVECPGMRRACVTEPATRYSCARGWHSTDDIDYIGRSAQKTPGERMSCCKVSFVRNTNSNSSGKQ